jgi:hypothetical protein
VLRLFRWLSRRKAAGNRSTRLETLLLEKKADERRATTDDYAIRTIYSIIMIVHLAGFEVGKKYWSQHFRFDWMLTGILELKDESQVA